MESHFAVIPPIERKNNFRVLIFLLLFLGLLSYYIKHVFKNNMIDNYESKKEMSRGELHFLPHFRIPP